MASSCLILVYGGVVGAAKILVRWRRKGRKFLSWTAFRLEPS